MRISAWSSDVCSSDLTIALPDDASHREAGHVERPFRAPGDARAVFPTIISGEAVEREQVGILQVDRARILVRDRQVAGAGRPDELDSRCERLDAAKRRPGKRPAYVDRRRRYAARLPALIAALERLGRQQTGRESGRERVWQYV